MTKYIKEATRKNLKGRLICGAGSGYKPKKILTLQQILNFLEEINNHFESRKTKTIPCIVKEGVVIGRTSDSQYKAKIYDLEFSWSPRARPISKKEFLKILTEYAIRLQKKIGLKRVYIEFGGRTTIFKKIE